jgi:two-component system cell cycle response regulator
MTAEILLIEDNRDDLELMACLLRGFGHRPLSVGCAEAALGVASFRTFDLVVCDLVLGRMTGFEVAEYFKASDRLKNIPLVAVSALTASSCRSRVLGAGFDGFISKPISPEEFIFQLQRFVKADLTHNMPPPTVVSPALEDRPAVQQHEGTILVVDDRPENLDLGRCMLEPFGFEVLTAGGVEEALASARKDAPSLILTDVHMGDGTGFDLVRTVREDRQLQHIPCLVISATYLEFDPRTEELGLDDTNFILRPIEPGALVAMIGACLEKACHDYSSC